MKYRLYDLRIVTKGDPGFYNCSHIYDEGIIVRGENFEFLNKTKSFSHYVFASLMPYIAAKQRVTDNKDWMKYEAEIACPDPKCSAIFRITQCKRVIYEYSGE